MMDEKMYILILLSDEYLIIILRNEVFSLSVINNM